VLKTKIYIFILSIITNFVRICHKDFFTLLQNCISISFSFVSFLVQKLDTDSNTKTKSQTFAHDNKNMAHIKYIIFTSL